MVIKTQDCSGECKCMHVWDIIPLVPHLLSLPSPVMCYRARWLLAGRTS